MNKKSAWYMSSEDPMALSLTIKGALMMYVPFILAIATNFHIPLTNTVLVNVITSVSFVISALMLAYGMGRKVYNYFKK